MDKITEVGAYSADLTLITRRTFVDGLGRPAAVIILPGQHLTAKLLEKQGLTAKQHNVSYPKKAEAAK